MLGKSRHKSSLTDSENYATLSPYQILKTKPVIIKTKKMHPLLWDISLRRNLKIKWCFVSFTRQRNFRILFQVSCLTIQLRNNTMMRFLLLSWKILFYQNLCFWPDKTLSQYSSKRITIVSINKTHPSCPKSKM